jgi:NADH-quinone oxidoreductase subunit H
MKIALILKLLMIVITALITIAYLTITERKIMASIQRRKGPNVVGIWGILQPIADGFKLLIKERITPLKSNWRLFLVAPIIVLSLSFLCWTLIPFTLETDNSLTREDLTKNIDLESYKRSILQVVYNINDEIVKEIPKFILIISNNCVYTITESYSYFLYDFTGSSALYYGILVLLMISSLNVYGIIMAGWSSYSKYAFFGALRSAAQMISYEVSITLILLPVIFLSGTMNLTEIVWTQMHTGWYVFTLFPSFVLFLISIIAETNRAPFDLPEAEAELVAGYNVEYSAITFAMFFLGEYSYMIIMSTLGTILFFGGWSTNLLLNSFTFTAMIFIVKILIFCFVYVLVRAALPRYRYDQLMDIGWKVFLPWALCIFWIILIANLNLNLNFFQMEIYLNRCFSDTMLFSSAILINNSIDLDLIYQYMHIEHSKIFQYLWFYR